MLYKKLSYVNSYLQALAENHPSCPNQLFNKQAVFIATLTVFCK